MLDLKRQFHRNPFLSLQDRSTLKYQRWHLKVPGQSLTWGQMSGQVEVRHAASCDLERWGKGKYDGAIYISNHAWLKMYKQKLISFRFITKRVRHLLHPRLRTGNPKQTFHMLASLYPTLLVWNHSDKNCFTARSGPSMGCWGNVLILTWPGEWWPGPT